MQSIVSILYIIPCLFYNITEDDVTKKIKNIRSQYGRERQKVVRTKKKTGTGLDEIYIPKWSHFDRLRFLDDFLLAKTTVTNIEVRVSILSYNHTHTLHSQIIVFCQDTAPISELK